MDQKKRKKVVSTKGVCILIFSVLIILLVLLLVSVASAGVLDWFREITGRAATAKLEMNISVGVPQIIKVYNDTIGLSAGPIQAKSNTNITVNFSVYSPSGQGNLNFSSAKVNLSSADEDTRTNSTCLNLDAAGDYANFTCQIEMWWWDGAATWTITAYIEDNNTNVAQNLTTTFIIGARQGFELGPGNLTWTAIGAGSKNQTAYNDPVILNNTGNYPINAPNIKINATNLRGEEFPNYGLWAGNFSVSHLTSAASAECGDSTSDKTVASTYQGLSPANLTKGNYTVNDKNTGQEELYFCLLEAGSELVTQAYSTWNESAWTIQIS